MSNEQKKVRITEGIVKKGGLNPKPTVSRPHPPKAQNVQKPTGNSNKK